MDEGMVEGAGIMEGVDTIEEEGKIQNIFLFGRILNRKMIAQKHPLCVWW